MGKRCIPPVPTGMSGQHMSRPVVLAAKLGWLILAVGILMFTLYLYDGTPATRDAELILVYSMLALAFPASQVVTLTLAAIGYVAEASGKSFSIPTTYLTIIVEWVVFLCAGYFQWFVLLPWLWRRWKVRRAHSPPQSV